MNRAERPGAKPAPLAWVVGGGGLVGRHVARALALAGHELFESPVRWRDEALSSNDLVAGMSRFGLERRGRPWLVAWCAGAGVVATPEEDLAAELRVFVRAMSALAATGGEDEEGVLVLASSAGGLYAGSQHPPFTEASEPQPLVAYGRTKLAMEDILASMAPVSGLRVVLARLANVYGPGQSLMKPQGLLSQLCLAHATGRALPVFVSTDTIRDYVYAGDVGAIFVALDARVREAPPGTVVVKVVASGRPVTVGHLVSEARRVFHRPLRTISVARSSAGQVLDLRLASRVWPEIDALASTTLPAGLERTAHDVLSRVVAGGGLDR